MQTTDTLEIIFSMEKKNLGKISSVCKKWKQLSGDFLKKEKDNFIKTNSESVQENLLEEFEHEVFDSCSLFTQEEYSPEWRNNINWEQSWYDYRANWFFYDDYIRKLNQQY